MRIYLAGGECRQWLEAINDAGSDRALFSYYYFEKAGEPFQAEALTACPDIFVDSGGFSAQTQGHKISITAYGRWLEKAEGNISAYANLDVIGDAEAIQKNQERLEGMGLSPIPVFHLGSPFSHLRPMVERYDYIALGGMVPFTNQKARLRNWLASCFSIIRGDAKVHGFGLTNFDLMKEFPFYSVDSTAWLAGTKFGKVFQFKGGTGFDVFSQGMERPSSITERSLQDQGDKRYYDRVVHNAAEWIKAERFLTRYWKRKGISW